MAELLLTADQRAAVELRERPVLVSAAAGAGKTRVLVERLIGYLTDAVNPRSIDKFLLVTYTTAAAEEMRGRIMERLDELLAEDPSDAHLRRQRSLALTAKIGTLHAFCLELYREFGASAGLPGGLRVGDEAEQGLLCDRVAERMLEEFYESGDSEDPGFAALRRMGVTMHGDRTLSRILVAAWKAMRSQPEPERWRERCLETLSPEVWETALLTWARERLGLWRERLHGILRQSAGDDPAAEALLDTADTLLAAARTGWDALTGALMVSSVKKPSKHPHATELKRFCADFESLEKVFNAPLDEQTRHAAATEPALRLLLTLLARFDERFTREKLSRRWMDYHDQESFALRILRGEGGSRTPAAELVSARFTELMVDEYQDINPLQEAIIELLSADGAGGNVFRVGDIRQSIYRFQNAEPELFRSKYEAFPLHTAAPSGPALVELSENFRSDESIINAVNHVFSRLMDHQSGEVDYRIPLLRGGQAAPDEHAGVEWLVTQRDKDSGLPDPAQEARAVAARLRAILDSTDFTPGDCAILVRSRTHNAHYVRALEEQGIACAERGDGAQWLESPELCALRAFLMVIDNPLQDIPLLAVLRSPVYAFTADELAELRCASGGSLYQGLTACDTEKCGQVREDLEVWRFLASEWPVWRLAARIIAQTRLAERVGGAAQTRLDCFVALAEGAAQQSLPGFLHWLGRLLDTGKVPVNPEPGARGAVRLTTIHSSKGLEYPLVVLPGLKKQFDQRDTTEIGQIQVHGTLGLALRRNDVISEYPTAPWHLLKQRRIWQTKAEELRLLYVAMTRARRRLLLSHIEGDAEGWLERLKLAAEHQGPYIAQSGLCYADWLTAAGAAPGWRVLIVKPEPPPERAAEPAPAPAEAMPEPVPYRHPAAIELPSKLTASDMKGRTLDFEAQEDAPPPPVWDDTFPLPDFGEKRGLTAAERGTAMHRALQWVNFRACLTEKDARAEINRLAALRLLTPEQAAAIDPRRITALTASPLGQRMLAAEPLYRESKFSFLEDASSLLGDPAAAGEQILLQGVIDCFFHDGGGWTVVDFKTDRVKPGEEAERAAQYRTQLAVYRRAVQRMMDVLEVRCWVLFVATGGAAEVEA